MKDALGHGSAAHSAGVDQIGKVPTTQEFRKMSNDLNAARRSENPDYTKIMHQSDLVSKASQSMAPGTHPLLEQPGTMQLGHVSATRYYKNEGFSGWVVRNEDDRHHYTDPISNKTDAKASMRDMYERTIRTPGHRLLMK